MRSPYWIISPLYKGLNDELLQHITVACFVRPIALKSPGFDPPRQLRGSSKDRRPLNKTWKYYTLKTPQS